MDRITGLSAVQKTFGYVTGNIKQEDSANISRYKSGTFCRAYHDVDGKTVEHIKV